VVKPSDIRLGETKYYTAQPDPDQFSNLIITESSSPDLGDGDERVIFEDPQIADDAVNNDTVGVYWDYMKPDTTGLDNGVIRLIGKRWKPDTTYKVKLHAVLKELGREGAIEIEVKTGCIHVASAKTPLSVGDTTDLVFTYSDTGIPVPGDKNLDVSILGGTGGENGTLLVNGSTGTNFPGFTQPIKYIAPLEIPEDELDVQIVAVESDGLSARIQGNNTHQSTGASLSKTSTISPRIVAVLKAQGTGASCPIGGVNVLTPVRIELNITKNILNHSETTPLNTILYDKHKNPINSFNANVQLDLGSECEGYGNLIGFSQGMSITVPYGIAWSGFVSCSANGQEWNNRFPLVARISASGVFGGKPLSDPKLIFIIGSNTIGKIFYQNGLWGGDLYDHTSSTIGGIGCALTCMAMVLSAYGVDVDPGELNTWMNENGGFNKDNKLQWKSLYNYPNSPLERYTDNGIGLKTDPVTGKTNIIPIKLPDMTNLETELAAGRPVIAQVLNTDSNNNHWVVITGKTSSGDYYILDPNGKPRVTLNSSYKTIYRYITTN
jgi:hypothetical protein